MYFSKILYVDIYVYIYMCVFESALLGRILKLAVIHAACAHFPIQFLPSSQLCI